MFKTRRNLVLVIAVCALLLPTTLIAKKRVTRPFRSHADQTIIINLSDGTWTVVAEIGEATHGGRYTASGGGTLTPTGLMGSGSDTVANGDELFWDVMVQDPNPPIVTFTGGTGRFAGASGSVTLTIIEQTQKIEFPLLTITQSFTGTGTITY